MVVCTLSMALGKTFLYNAINARKRSEGIIVIAIASSGIAANLLSGGKTAHAALRTPLEIFYDSACNIHQDLDLADMIIHADCIIQGWPERLAVISN